MKSFLVVGAVLLCAPVLCAQQVTNVSDHDVPKPKSQAQTTASTAGPQQARLDEAALDMMHKQYSEAVAVYQALLKENPKDASLWNHLGIAYEDLAQSDNDYGKESLKCYDKAEKLDKTNASFWNNQGTMYFYEKKYSRAIKSYEKAIEIDNSNATFYANLGMAYFDTKKLPEAIVAFHNALALDSEVFTHTPSTGGSVLQDRSVKDHGLFYFLLAKSYAGDGNAERCVFFLKKSRDEGYAELAKAKDDPAFARVINDPSFRDIVGLPALPAVQPKSLGL